jgi:hypothetical protein
MVLMIAHTVLVGLAVLLLGFGILFALGHVALIDESTVPVLAFGVFATFNLPIIVKFREYGVENLHFDLHEDAMNQLMNPPESWSNTILALLDETAQRSNELVILVRLIDEAPGPVERQERRAEAKTWLLANRDKLTEEDRDFVNQYLGYLFKP